MQLLILAAIVAAVSISEYAPPQPVANATVHVLLAVLAMGIAPAFAAATSTMIAGSLRDPGPSRPEVLRWFGRLRALHGVVWFLLAAFVLHQLAWARVVRFNWNLNGVLLVDDLLLFLPIVAPLVLSWAAFYEVERRLQLAGADTVSAGTIATRGQYVMVHVRHYLGLLLLPVLAVLAMQDLVPYLAPMMPGESEAVLLLPPIVGLLLFFPLVLKVLWQARPLPEGELRDRLVQCSQRLAFRPAEFLIWPTQGMMVNAAVAGLISPLRYVFFTDALLDRFTTDEIETVLAHEIGHIRRRHLLYRLLVLALPVVLWLALARAFPQLVENAKHAFAIAGLSEELVAAIAGPLGLTLFAATVFARHSRWLEHDADLFALRACSNESGGAAGSRPMVDVLEKLACTGGTPRRGRSWLHPTIAERVEFLTAMSETPDRADRFQRRIRAVHRAMLGLLTTAAAYLLYSSA